MTLSRYLVWNANYKQVLFCLFSDYCDIHKAEKAVAALGFEGVQVQEQFNYGRS